MTMKIDKIKQTCNKTANEKIMWMCELKMPILFELPSEILQI